MELNREQAIDILDKFDFFQGQRAGRELWNNKPFDVQEQDISNFSQDVALLKNYIKELTEENESLEAEKEHLELVVESKLKRTSALEKKVLELTKENEAWQKQLLTTKESSDKAYYDLACEVEDLRAIAEQYQKQFEEAKADTVRDFTERLKEGFRKYDRANWAVRAIIDEIAKEMMEDNT